MDAFVAAIGTGGTILGVAETLKVSNPDMVIIGVEPSGARTIVNGQLVTELVDPVGGGLLQELLDKRILDDVVGVDERDAVEVAHTLAETEGIYCGLSSGANVLVALQLARSMKEGEKVVTVLPDSRDRYLFTERFTT